MQREIYSVNAWIIQSTGAFSALSGYPKTFDSRSYDNDLEKTLNRAKAEWCNVLSGMGNRDDRPLQMACVIRMSDGLQIFMDKYGAIPEEPESSAE